MYLKILFWGGGRLIDPLIQTKTNKLYMMLILKRVDAALPIVIRLLSPLINCTFYKYCTN